jgi:hypothetical protein
MPRSKNFTTAVEKFLKTANDWLTDEDAPAVAALQGAAVELDIEISPALLSAYGLTYRNLLRRKPTDLPEADTLGSLLDQTTPHV